MKFDNQTPFPAALDVGSTTDLEQLGVLSCRISYQWDEAGQITPLPAALMWPIAKGMQEFEGTLMLPDSDYRREAIDILLFGDAMAPDGQPVTRMRVGAASGKFLRQYDVIGDRHWMRLQRDGQWSMSEPEPFLRMPLTCDRSFGGVAQMQGAEIPHVMNPSGRGLVYEEQTLEGTALPNIERIDSPIRHWQDAPVPACFHKPQGGLLLAASGPESWAEAAQNRQHLMRVVQRQLFQQAPPDWVCPHGALGPELALQGLSAERVMRFALPPELASTQRGAMAYVEVGARRAVLPLRIVSLIVLAAQRMLIVGFAAAFRYMFFAGEQRRALLRWHGDTSFERGRA